MDLCRLLRTATAAAAVLALSACTPTDAGPPEQPSGSRPTQAAPTGAPTPSANPTAAAPTDAGGPVAGAEPSSTPEAGPAGGQPALPGLPSGPVTPERPVPKVERSGSPQEPEVTASPVEIREEVEYSDGVRLRITDVVFDVEEGEGPGRFPGREFAVLSVELHNGTETALSLDTVVMTVLDRAGQAVAPVYVEGQDVRDFSGTVPPDGSASARYAFAVPSESRSEVTVVVDFDGVHTSAVFRGQLV